MNNSANNVMNRPDPAKDFVIKILDTFPAFDRYWKKFQHSSTEDQIGGWASSYMGNWPELLEKQIKQYEIEATDWKQIASGRIFPFIEERLPEMRLAHKNLLKECKPIYLAVQKKFGYNVPLVVVIYVGIGLGAGWATTYQESPALLFGLENIAEEGWSDPATVKGLIAHELGHLIHSHWREGAGKDYGAGPLWDLYTEGFAERCEQLILGENNYHMDKMMRMTIGLPGAKRTKPGWQQNS